MTSSEIFTLLIFFMVLLTIATISMIILFNYHKKEIERLTQYDINVNAGIDEEIPKILEMYVAYVFADYRAKYLDPIQLGYITPEKEKDIRQDVAKLCGDRLSSAMVDKLSLFWNYKSIGAVIADKVYLTVVAYCADHNQTKEDAEKIK